MKPNKVYLSFSALLTFCVVYAMLSLSYAPQNHGQPPIAFFRVRPGIEYVTVRPYAYFRLVLVPANTTYVYLDPSGSFDVDGTVELYEWDIDGDGLYEFSTRSPQIIRLGLHPPPFNVVLRVTDEEGLTNRQAAWASIIMYDSEN